MSKIKLVATDLDGTLFNSKTEISDFTKQTIMKLLAQGIQFVPCSARTLKWIDPWLREQAGIKYVVSSNGAVVADNHTEEFLLVNAISAKDAIEILKEVEDINPYWSIDTNGSLYSHRAILTDHEKIGVTGSYYENVIATRIFLDDYHEILDDEKNSVRKIHFITYDMDKREVLKQALEKFEMIQVTSSHFENLEILDINASKGIGLSWVLEKENINRNEVFAFGDNDNDIELFKSVDYGIAVANATENLKKHAFSTTSTNDEDGVAKYIVEHILDSK